MCAHPLVIVYFDSFKRNEQFASITPDFHQELSCSLLAAADPISGGWIQVAAVLSPDHWMQVTTKFSSGRWIQVTADSILRPTRVLAAGYQLQQASVEFH